MATTEKVNGNASSSASFSLIVDNTDISTATTFDVHDPFSGDVVHAAPAASVQDGINAVESAERAFASWRHSTPLEKRTIFNKAAILLQDRKSEIVDAMVKETPALASWAAFNISTAIQFVQEAAGIVTQIKGEIVPSNDKGRLNRISLNMGCLYKSLGTLAMVFREPCGVVLGIAPWNAPIVSTSPLSLDVD